MDEDLRTPQNFSKLKLGWILFFLLIVLGIGGYSLLGMYFEGRYTNALDSLEAKGLPMTQEALLALRTVYAKSDDAMPVYRELAEATEGDAAVDCGRNEKTWRCESYRDRGNDIEPDLREVLSQLAPWDERLIEATHRPGITLQWNENEHAQHQSFQDIKALLKAARLLGHHAYAAILDRDADKALLWFEATFNFLIQCQDVQMLMGLVTLNSEYTVLMENLYFALEQDLWTDAQLKVLDEHLKRIDPAQQLRNGLVEEAGFAISFTQRLEKPSFLQKTSHYMLHSGYMEYYNDLFQESHPDFTLNRAQFFLPEEEQSMMVSMIIPALKRAAMQSDNLHIQRDFARLVIALKIYKLQQGAYPDSLEQLSSTVVEQCTVNPLSGIPYTYTVEGSGFSLYDFMHKEINWAFGS